MTVGVEDNPAAGLEVVFMVVKKPSPLSIRLAIEKMSAESRKLVPVGLLNYAHLRSVGSNSPGDDTRVRKHYYKHGEQQDENA
jgi:hypothetical protein